MSDITAYEYFTVNAERMNTQIQSLKKGDIFPVSAMEMFVTFYCSDDDKVITALVDSIVHDGTRMETVVVYGTYKQYLCPKCQWFIHPSSAKEA